MLKITPDSFKQCVADLESGSNIEAYKIMMFKAMLFLFRKEYLSGISEENNTRTDQIIMQSAMKQLGRVINGLGVKDGEKGLLYLHPQIILRPNTITLSVANPGGK